MTDLPSANARCLIYMPPQLCLDGLCAVASFVSFSKLFIPISGDTLVHQWNIHGATELPHEISIITTNFFLYLYFPFP